MGDRVVSNAWRVLAILFLANLLNFFDRAIPAIIMEPIRLEWSLSDLQLGFVASTFTLAFAVFCIPLGRLADTRTRKSIVGFGLIAWSAFTGLSATAWSFWSFLTTRIGVGIGEASYLPAATSLIGDLFPANRRSRAMGIFMLGLPCGLLLAFFSVGAIVSAFGSWRAPFLVAIVPGLLLASFAFAIREPVRGASEIVKPRPEPVIRPIRSVLMIRSMRWILLAGIASNFASYAANSFLVPLMQRFFGLTLELAAVSTGAIVGLTGLIGLTLGGWVADYVHERSQTGRLTMGGICLVVAAGATWSAFGIGPERPALFVAVFGFGWLMQYAFYVCVYPAMHDVVEPKLRGTAMAIFAAAINLVGGAFGPLFVGLLSDHYATQAMMGAGGMQMLDEFRAIGLHQAMAIVPIALLLTAFGCLLAIRTFPTDARSMIAHLEGNGSALAK
ncbi:MAG: MFS transporter [Rhizobiaceae bacterium]|nr:MFS transporter [Rhizobiaceae bacterium]